MSDSGDPIDGSPPGSPVPGILQARTLEWVAIFLLQSRKVKSESEVAQSCPTLSDPMDRSPPGSPVHGIFQARVAEWATVAYCTLKQKLAIPFELFLICRLLKMILFFNLLNPH